MELDKKKKNGLHLIFLYLCMIQPIREFIKFITKIQTQGISHPLKSIS